METQTQQLAETNPGHRVMNWIRHNSWVQAPLFVCSWLGIWFVAYIVEYVNHASVWFPAAGLTFAGLLVVGARLIPVLTVCAVLCTIWTGYIYDLNMSIPELIFPGIVFAITHITPYYIATRLLKRFNHHQVHQLPALMIGFFGLAIVSSFIAAFAVIYGLVLTDMMTMDDVASAWLPFWVGDMAGIIAVGPLFVGVLTKLYAPSQFWVGELKLIAIANGSNSYAIKLGASTLILFATMLFGHLHPAYESNLSIFLMILPLMWIAYTESALRTALAVALFSFSVAFFVNLFGLMDYVLIYQFTICLVAASAFLYVSVPSLVAHNQELKFKTITDHLTGIASREHLLEHAELEITRSRYTGEPLSLLVFDLDNFKRVNDELGHTEGDNVLVEVSNEVAKCLRHSDLLSRFGGDEFVTLMPNTNSEQAFNLADRILNHVSQVSPPDGSEITCSIGIAQLEAGQEFRQLFEKADKALYEAKNGGRNQAVIAHAE